MKRVTYEAVVLNADEDRLRFLDAVLRYHAVLRDGVDTGHITRFVVHMDPELAPRFEEYCKPVRFEYRSPVRYAFGRLVPIYASAEDEIAAMDSDARNRLN